MGCFLILIVVKHLTNRSFSVGQAFDQRSNGILINCITLIGTFTYCRAYTTLRVVYASIPVMDCKQRPRVFTVGITQKIGDDRATLSRDISRSDNIHPGEGEGEVKRIPSDTRTLTVDRAECSLHDAERSLHDAECSLHDVECSLHDAERSLHDAE